MPLLAERLREWDKRREKRRTRGLRPQYSRASAQAAAGVIAAGTKRKFVPERGGPPAEVGLKDADFREDLEMVAKCVDEHSRLPRQLGPDATEAQREERARRRRASPTSCADGNDGFRARLVFLSRTPMIAGACCRLCHFWRSGCASGTRRARSAGSWRSAAMSTAARRRRCGARPPSAF